MRVKKATVRKAKRTPARKKTATPGRKASSRPITSVDSPSTAASSLWWTPGPGPVIFGIACVVCFVGAVVLLPAHEDPTATSSQSSYIGSQPTPPGSRQPSGSQTPASGSRSPRAARTESPKTSVETNRAIAPAPPAADPVKTTSNAWAPAAEPVVKTAAPAPVAAAPATVASVTITGCLEHDDEAFWLSDTSGSDAPMSRSWRSGFLRKRPSRIEVVDAGHALRLTSYVGQRVSATGTLVNREMRPRSLHPVSASCS